MNEITFSHRPNVGISVAAKNNGSELCVAVSLVNNGVSKNGLLWEQNKDIFSPKIARIILIGRLNDSSTDGKRIHRFKTDLSPRQFMDSFRKKFKPTHDESDALFVTRYYFADTGLNMDFRKNADEIFNEVKKIIHEVVQIESTRIRH